MSNVSRKGGVRRTYCQPSTSTLANGSREGITTHDGKSIIRNAIITAAKMCEPGLEDQVTYTKALDEKGIPYFVGEFEENMTSFDHLQIQLETFVESLLFA